MRWVVVVVGEGGGVERQKTLEDSDQLCLQMSDTICSV